MNHHHEQAVLDWLTGERTPEATAAWRRALQADPELLPRMLAEVRFDHQLARCLADGEPAFGRPAAPAAADTEARHSMNAEQQKIWARIVAQAWADESYKARLLAEPEAVLREAGLEVPAGMNVSVVENTDSRAYLVLPALPPEAQTAAEHEVRLAAGCSGCACGCIWW